jgi:hypothetical protein
MRIPCLRQRSLALRGVSPRTVDLDPDTFDLTAWVADVGI